MKRSNALGLIAKGSWPVVLLVAGLLLPLTAFALPINVVSQQYSITGTGRYAEGPEVSYNETASQELSKTLDYGGYYGGYTITTRASGGLSSNGAWVEAYAGDYNEGWTWSDGSASATITFRPLVTSMLVNAGYWDGGHTSLTDLTLNTTLFQETAYGDHSYLLSFDLSHLYAMTAVSSTLYQKQYMSVQSAPEPSTMLLLCLGLGGLCMLRKK